MKITLTDVTNFTNDNSAVAGVNGNSNALEVAFENTLSRDGTSPNQMGADFDMNSHRILNLPAPVAATDVVRLQELATIAHGGTISPVPIGGTTGQVLTKNSNTTYDYSWQSPSNPSTPTFTNITLTGSSSGSSVLQASAVASGTITFPAGTDTVVTLAATQTLTNKSLTSPALTGVPVAPTATAGTNNTQIATTAYADTALALKAPLASPTLTGVPLAPTATAGTSTTQIATTSFVQTAIPTPNLMSVMTFGVDNTGVTDTHSSLQTAFTNITSLGNIAYVPPGIYNMGGGRVVPPDNSRIICADTAIIRRTANPASPATAYNAVGTTQLYGIGTMISLGNNVTWTGGTLDNTVSTATSTSSVSIGTGAKTFTTIGSGLPFAANDFLRIFSSSNPANRMEGNVTSFSGSTLVMNISFNVGTGSPTDWVINYGGTNNAAMECRGVSNTIIEQVQLTGRWYGGLMFDGWNPSTGGVIAVSNCIIRNCICRSVFNRSIYLFGTTSDCIVDSCYVDGGGGISDYGIQMNAGNGTGSFNQANRNKVQNSFVRNTVAQGFVIGDRGFDNKFINNTAYGLGASGQGFGFMAEFGNGNASSRTSFVGCRGDGWAVGMAHLGTTYDTAYGCELTDCGDGVVIGPTAGVQSQFIHHDGTAADVNTNGFHVKGNSERCSLLNIRAFSNGTGVLIDAGANLTLITGRARNNTTANLTDAGTGTVSAGATAAGLVTA